MSSLLLRGIARTASKLRSPLQLQKANFVVGPPKNPLPFPQKVIYGSAAVIIIWGPGLYMLSNFKHYYAGDPNLFMVVKED